MKHIVVNKKSLILPLLFTLLVLNTCSFFSPGLISPEEIVIVEPEFTIAWDPPDDEERLAGYRIYYSPVEEGDWLLIQQLDDPETTEYTIQNGTLPYGIFVFAVSSLSEDGVESEKHTSLDKTAIPKTGWFVKWLGTE
ncbi:MAG: fibronectin type III domain-containing protein [Fibrobacterota bacterium]